MTKVAEYRIAQLYSECKTPEELSRLRELENIYKDQVLNKISSIWIISAKVDKIKDAVESIDRKLYGK